MTNYLSSPAAAAAFFSLSCLAATPAWALAPVTFVSGKGVDTGACASPASPCRTFQYALGQTSAGGEIKALDPADYSPVFISQSISITGVEGAGIFRKTNGDAITIWAGANGVVNLTGLTVDGTGEFASSGVALYSASQLTIRNFTARNYIGSNGIYITPIVATKVLIENAVIANNLDGIRTKPSTRGSVNLVLRHASLTDNGIGMNIFGATKVMVADSVIADNSAWGISLLVESSTIPELLIAHSIVTQNRGTGLSAVESDGLAKSAGDNFIRGNGTDIRGTLFQVGTH